MFPSLTSRIVALGAVIMTALLALVLLLVDASVQTRDSFRWVIHSAEVIETMDNALVELRDAPSHPQRANPRVVAAGVSR